MNNYIPFLKLKANEMGALSELEPAIKSITYPFLDLPKKQFSSEEEFLDTLTKYRKSVGKHAKDCPVIFLDDFDNEDSLEIKGENSYGAVIDAFSDLAEFVPVIGLDREGSRNEIVFQRKEAGILKSNNIVIRLQVDDFENFALAEPEILSLKARGQGLFDYWSIILDNRLCLNVNARDRSQKIVSFINSAVDRLDIYAFIISGSSISASIRDILNVEKEHHHARTELDIYRNTVPHLGGVNIYLGDYTVVSPYYSDVDIPKEAMQNVTAPKVIYSYGGSHYIARGGAIKTHKRGLHQYNDIAAHIVKQPFYRTPGYSYGDNFIYLKSLGQGNKVTPGSILKPTINLHITYMLRDFTI